MNGRALASGVAIVVLVTGAAIAAQGNGAAAEAALPVVVDVAAPPPVVACPGSQTVPVGDVGIGGELSSEPTVHETSVLAPAEATATGLGAAANAEVAAQVERIADGDIAGWAALTCGSPANEQWLVGGSTSVGSSARLVLSNPSAAPSEATVTVYGPLGEVEDTIVVPVGAGDAVDRLLEATAPGVSAVVVHVVATGPGVVAALQDSRLSGFQPAGTAWVGASDPGTSLAVPGVGLDLPDAFATVRLMAPEGATVNLTLVSQQGIETWAGGSRELRLEQGVVTDIDVPVEGLRSVQIEADAAVVAAARTVVPREATEGIEGDLAYEHEWVQALAPTDVPRTAVVPSADARVVAFAPLGGTLTLTSAEGAVVATKRLPARVAQWVDIAAKPGTVVTSEGAVAWAFVMTSEDGMVAALAPLEVSGGSLSASVVPGAYGPASG